MSFGDFFFVFVLLLLIVLGFLTGGPVLEEKSPIQRKDSCYQFNDQWLTRSWNDPRALGSTEVNDYWRCTTFLSIKPHLYSSEKHWEQEKPWWWQFMALSRCCFLAICKQSLKFSSDSEAAKIDMECWCWIHKYFNRFNCNIEICWAHFVCILPPLAVGLLFVLCGGSG